MKFTAAMAMPTPKSTPARTRFEPPSPNAKVKPDTTIATRERPRAIVLVNAVIKTLTAFSQGELPVACAKAGGSKKQAHRNREGLPGNGLEPNCLLPNCSHVSISPLLTFLNRR